MRRVEESAERITGVSAQPLRPQDGASLLLEVALGKMRLDKLGEMPQG